MEKLFNILTELENGFLEGKPTQSSIEQDQKHSEKYSKILELYIRENGITKEQFNQVAKEFRGLDLVYSDYCNNSIDSIVKNYAKLLIENAKMKALLITFKVEYKDGEKDLFVAMINNLEIEGV